MWQKKMENEYDSLINPFIFWIAANLVFINKMVIVVHMF
jgi:hypothetical protein